jgi:DNA-binding LacI/PurR family transcriptional regulator/transposase
VPTIRQLANIAGVSTSTVSLALRNHQRISEATRRRIQQLAKQYQYKLPQIRRRFDLQSCGVIGCILPLLPVTKIIAQLVGELEARAFTDSYRVVILNNHMNVIDTHLAIQTLIEQRVDGILVDTEAIEPLPNEIFIEAESQGIPIVCLNVTPTTRPHDLVGLDYVQLGKCTVEYLHTLGHRHIMYCGLRPWTPPHQAIAKAIRHFGMRCTFLYTLGEVLIGEMAQAFQQASPPTAIAGNDDERMLLSYQFALCWGLRIPQDISVIGCYNLLGENCAVPQLTTIDPCMDTVAHRAYALLKQRMRERQMGEAPAKPEIIHVPPRLVIRESCAPPRHQALELRTLAQVPAVEVSFLEPPRKPGPSTAIDWHPDDTVEALEQRFRAEVSSELRPRWQALWLLRQGVSRTEAADAVQVHLRTLYRWLAWYRTGRMAQLASHRIGGCSRFQSHLTDEHRAQLTAQVQQGAIQTIKEACDWVAQTYQIQYTYWGMRKLLHRLLPSHYK